MAINAPTLLAVGVRDAPTMGNIFAFQFVGFLIVMTVLASLWILLRFVGYFFVNRRGEDDAAQTPSTAPPPSPGIAAAAPHGVMVAVITAAVHTVHSGQYRILSIHEHFEDNLGAWSAEGRRQIFSSHSVR